MRDLPKLFYLQNDETLQNCRKELLVSDQVQVISEVKNSITKIWDESDCISKFFLLLKSTLLKHLLVYLIPI